MRLRAPIDLDEAPVNILLNGPNIYWFQFKTIDEHLLGFIPVKEHCSTD